MATINYTNGNDKSIKTYATEANLKKAIENVVIGFPGVVFCVDVIKVEGGRFMGTCSCFRGPDCDSVRIALGWAGFKVHA